MSLSPAAHDSSVAEDGDTPPNRVGEENEFAPLSKDLEPS